ncbi:MAG: dTDP-4-dehydrorhamnose reductase [Kofleriaceae bacterium]|nr:dTDP-4-dehydrorhamnose reductase [Kofleriaceae bacterium]
MRVLVTGGHGQLGRALVRRAPVGDVLHAVGREVLDVTRPPTIARCLDELAPDVVINAAAFTNVDLAETDHARAHAVNAAGAHEVARACAERGIRLIHVSTDYVFDGFATRPYREEDPVAPLNVYGASKAAGERAVRELGGIIVRTAWLFGEGGPSFVHAIARRAAEQPVLRVVDDQWGSPTWADDLADALLGVARAPSPPRVLHVCGDEPASRYAFAQVIVEEARRLGPIACTHVEPVQTGDFGAAARRPRYSVLDTSRARAAGLPIGAWREGVRHVLEREGRVQR